jgi:hypothetical protein
MPGPTLRSRHRLLGGGVDGNERLTTMVGLILLPLLAALGVTIVFIGRLIWWHFFLGLLLVGPVLLKMASTGYRFTRYYTGDRDYVAKGPPETFLRLIAPVVVLATVTVWASGIALLFQGPAHRGTLFLIHKASFIVWLAFVGLHVLTHLPAVWRYVEAFGHPRRSVAQVAGAEGWEGREGRGLAFAGLLVAGAVLALVLVPYYSSWTARGVLHHRHRHPGPQAALGLTRVAASPCQRAYSTARDSRITVTLICPGYSSSFSISRAIS